MGAGGYWRYLPLEDLRRGESSFWSLLEQEGQMCVSKHCCSFLELPCPKSALRGWLATGAGLCLPAGSVLARREPGRYSLQSLLPALHRCLDSPSPSAWLASASSQTQFKATFLLLGYPRPEHLDKHSLYFILVCFFPLNQRHVVCIHSWGHWGLAT